MLWGQINLQIIIPWCSLFSCYNKVSHVNESWKISRLCSIFGGGIAAKSMEPCSNRKINNVSVRNYGLFWYNFYKLLKILGKLLNYVCYINNHMIIILHLLNTTEVLLSVYPVSLQWAVFTDFFYICTQHDSPKMVIFLGITV